MSTFGGNPGAITISANMDLLRTFCLSFFGLWNSIVAVEWTIPEAPLSVATVESSQGNYVMIDWGVAGTARARHPQLIDEEREAMMRWIKSPEFILRMSRLQQMAEAHEKDFIQKVISQWWLEYKTLEQQTKFQRRIGRIIDEHPLPPWAWGIPLDIRGSIQIILFDDRDPVQRQFVLDRSREANGQRYTVAFCTGWKNGEDRDVFWREHPGIGQFAPLGTDDIVSYYQVADYPAVIQFGEETMKVEQGLDSIQSSSTTKTTPER